MAATPQFGAQVNQVGVAPTTGDSAKQAAANLINSDSGILDIGQMLAQSTQVLNAVKTTEANASRDAYVQLITSEDYQKADHTTKANIFEDSYKSMSDNKSSTYINAFKGYSAGEYAKSVKGRHEEYITSEINSAGAGYTSWMEEDSGENQQGFGVEDSVPLTNRAINSTASDWIDYKVQANPDLKDKKVELGQAVLNEEFGKIALEIQVATTEEDLSNALANVEDIKAGLNTPFLLGSKQKEAINANTDRNTKISNLVKAKQAQFKDASYGRISGAIGGGYREPTANVIGDINKTASNQVAATKQIQEYNKKHLERNQADVYNTTYSVGDRTGYLPDNKILKDERQEYVTQSLYNNFVADNAGEFVRVADNEIGMTKKTGVIILTQFNKTESSAEMYSIMTRLNKINEVPKGATVLRQMITDDEYARMMSIKNMTIADPTRTMKENRAFVDKTAQALQTLKLDPSSNSKMLEYAQDLGKQASNYVDVIKRMLLVDPNMTDDQYKEVAKRFQDTVQKDSTGMLSDTSMSPSPAQGRDIINPDAVDEAINAALPEGTSSVAHLPGGIVVAYDNMSGTIAVLDINEVVQDSEKATTESLISQQLEITKGVKTSPIVGAKVALKSFTRTVIDNIATVPGGMLDVGGQLVDKLQDHLFDSMSPGQQEFFKGWKPNQKEEFISSEIIIGLNSKIDSLPTKLPGVSNNTFDPITKEQLKQAISKNKVEKKKFSSFRDGVQGVPSSVISHIESREGTVYKSYKDSLGKPTGGTGHLLSKEEQKVYPIGTNIPKEVIDRWRIQDSKKAYLAAQSQANDLGITSPEFLAALTSVNFQLGTSWNKKFSTAYKHLKADRYEEAIQRILFTKQGSDKKSLWNEQTPNRVQDFVTAIRRL